MVCLLQFSKFLHIVITLKWLLAYFTSDLTSLSESSCTILTYNYLTMEDRTISPDSLRKDELRAEFLCRGFAEDVNVDLTTLLTKCKEIKLFEKPLVAAYSNGDVESENNCIETALQEFNEAVIEFQSTGLTDKQFRRLLHRITHWKNRNSVISQFTELNEILAAQQVRATKFTDLIENLKFLKASLAECSASKDKTSVLLTEVNQSVGILQPSILDLPNNLTSETFSATQDQPPRSLRPVTVSGVEQRPEGIGGFKFRMLELPNPVENLIRDFPYFEISDVEQAFGFLKRLVMFREQVKAFQITDVQIFQILLSHTKGTLAILVTEAIYAQLSIRAFQEIVIKEFIPSRLFHSLLSKYYYRTQKVSERFLEFARDIELVKEALLIPQSEAEAVRMVGIGATLPEVRSLFLGLFPPTTWRQLRELGPHLNDAAAAHHQFTNAPVTTNSARGFGRASNNFVSGQSTSNLPDRGGRPPLRCSWCNKMGHLADRCWARLGHRPVTRRNASDNDHAVQNSNP